MRLGRCGVGSEKPPHRRALPGRAGGRLPGERLAGSDGGRTVAPREECVVERTAAEHAGDQRRGDHDPPATSCRRQTDALRPAGVAAQPDTAPSLAVRYRAVQRITRHRVASHRAARHQIDVSTREPANAATTRCMRALGGGPEAAGAQRPDGARAIGWLRHQRRSVHRDLSRSNGGPITRRGTTVWGTSVRSQPERLFDVNPFRTFIREHSFGNRCLTRVTNARTMGV